MELKLDKSKTYAIALEGGGAKGAYQVGAWEALEEAGIKYNAVSGTSVGALNGALMTLRDLARAKDIWLNISISKVMDTDDDIMKKLFSGNIELDLIKKAAKTLKNVIANKGFDITPLYNMIGEVADETKIRFSDVDFYIITYSLTDLKELELRAKDLGKGEIRDMLLASAYLPYFKNEKLGGKRYTDGGVRDALPIHALTANGYKDIIAIRLYGHGIIRRFKMPGDVSVHTVAPTDDLGGIIHFDSELSRRNLQIGYFDMKRMLYGLSGRKYYIDRSRSEEESYRFIVDFLLKYLKDHGMQCSFHSLNNKIIPSIEKYLNVKGDYYDTMTAMLEESAAEAGMERFKIYTDDEFISAVTNFCSLIGYPKYLSSAIRKTE